MEQLQKYLYRLLLAVVIVILSGGTVFYHFVEKWNWVDSYYFSVVTLATVGYGDFVPKTDLGKIFTTFYVMAGVGIITTFFTFTMRRMKERVEKKNRKNKKK